MITVDLRIIENKKLRKIISKGLNNTEPKIINWKKIIKSFAEGLSNLIKGKLLSSKKISGKKDPILI